MACPLRALPVELSQELAVQLHKLLQVHVAGHLVPLGRVLRSRGTPVSCKAEILGSEFLSSGF